MREYSTYIFSGYSRQIGAFDKNNTE